MDVSPAFEAIWKESSWWPDPLMQEDGDIRFSALLYSPNPWQVKRRRFYTFCSTDLDDGGLVNLNPLDAVLSDEGRTSSDFPILPSHCNIGHSLFLVGGLSTSEEVPRTYSNNLLSFNSAASPTSGGFATWSICTKMQHGRSNAMAVPYDGKIFIIGGTRSRDSWIEIYDPQSNKLVGSMDLPEDDPIILPTSYFVWKDSMARPHQKPLILLYCPTVDGHHQLYSYDVELNRMKFFDPYFPPPARASICPERILIPLGLTGFLLIIDRPDFWSVYNLSTKKVTAKVLLHRLKHNGRVRHAFCRRSKEQSMILYIFMDFYKEEDGGGDDDDYFVFEREHSYYTDIPYAKVKLRTDGFVAIVESRGILRVGDYFEIYMFAEQMT